MDLASFRKSRRFVIKMSSGIQGTQVVSGFHQNHCFDGLAFKFFRENLGVTLI